ncbi:MAG: hypothetical protein LBU86_01805 [Oscillospiraceae bacterium]|nr:hypothetical protein [Oscillospiraceae bacterium]
MINQPHVIINRYPPAAPPATIPGRACPGNREIPRMLANCLYSCVYVWTRHYGEFWMYPISVSPGGIITGYRWDSSRWRLIDLPGGHIESFY